MSRVLAILSGALLAVLSAGLPTSAWAADKKPPTCAAISFRPLAGDPTDGEMEAGLYKSRFGKIEIRTMVKGGRPGDYYMLVNGRPPAALNGEIPKSAYACLNAKHVKTPPQSQAPTCTGSRFRVVIDSTGKDKLLMLFGLHGGDWKLCKAATAPA